MPYAVGTAGLANGLGLFDVAGNAWEWVADFYAADTYGAAVTDPKGPASGTTHVLRGGGYDTSNVAFLTASRRSGGKAQRAGFRCARSVQ